MANDTLVGSGKGNEAIQGREDTSVAGVLGAGIKNDLLDIITNNAEIEFTKKGKQVVEFTCKVLQEWNLSRSTQFAVFGFDESDGELQDFLLGNPSQDIIERCYLIYELKRILDSVFPDDITRQVIFLNAKNGIFTRMSSELSSIDIFNTKSKDGLIRMLQAFSD